MRIVVVLFSVLLLSWCQTMQQVSQESNTPETSQEPIVQETKQDNTLSWNTTWADSTSEDVEEDKISMTTQSELLQAWADHTRKTLVVNNIPQETIEEIISAYNIDNINFIETQIKWDSIITKIIQKKVKDGDISYFEQIVAQKINGKRVMLYEWNSWEISCSLYNRFWFAKELLTWCIQSGAEYTIPAEALEIEKKEIK